jgi:murein DD-endopeptidase MepM/ murein hydrolase activator NlpD
VGLSELFGVRGAGQVWRDYGAVLGGALEGKGFALDVGTLVLLRPRLSLPAYLGRVPRDGLAPIFNLFDRTAGGRGYGNRVSRRACRDWRGGRLSYDEHDGTDFVVPPLTPLLAAAPGVLVAVRDCWLRGGLTAALDHGDGVVTQYSHLARVAAPVGARLRRGEPVGWSGVSGAEMTTFCPWVPPHVHFMVWVHGRPVDPFGSGAARPGRPAWWPEGRPVPAAGPLPDDPAPPELDELPVDVKELARWSDRCTDEAIRREIEGHRHPASRLAVLEDSLHHDRRAWPTGCGEPLPRLRGLGPRTSQAESPQPRAPQPESPRPSPWRDRGGPERAVWLTLPLPADRYCGARPADTWLTRP